MKRLSELNALSKSQVQKVDFLDLFQSIIQQAIMKQSINLLSHNNDIRHKFLLIDHEDMLS